MTREIIIKFVQRKLFQKGHHKNNLITSLNLGLNRTCMLHILYVIK